MMPDFDSFKEVVGWVFGGSAAVVVAALGLWLKQSRTRVGVSANNLAMQENASQGGWITRLEVRVKAAEDRESALREEHSRCMRENAQLSARVGSFERDMVSLRREISRLRRLVLALRPDLHDVFDSEHGGLTDLPPAQGAPTD